MKTPIELKEAVTKYQKGNTECFSQIYEMSYKYIFTCAIHVVKDEEAAMDMTQETYLEINRSIAQLKNTEDFLSWAAMIGNRKCFAYLKKNSKELLIHTDDEDNETDFFENIPDDDAFIPETVLQNKEKQRLIRDIIDGLSDMQRLCVIGFYYNEQKQEDIAQELGIPVSTVKSHINRAKAKIKEEVIDLNISKGTKLYSLAPFMLLFFAEEVSACTLQPISEGLGTQIQQTAIKKVVGMTAKTKVIVGVAASVAVVGIAVSLITIQNQKKDVTPAEVQVQEQAESESTTLVQEDVTEDVTEEMAGVSEDTAEVNGVAEPLPISGQYDDIAEGIDGIVIVKKDDKWGLVTYDNEVIVPITYDYACKQPNNEGQTFFGNDGEYKVFDKEGNVIFETEHKIEAVSEGVVLIEEENEEEYTVYFQYVKLDGTVLHTVDTKYAIGQSGGTGFSEGYGFYAENCEERMDANGALLNITKVQSDIRNKPYTADEDTGAYASITYSDSTLYVPVGATSQNYYVSLGMGFPDSFGKYQLTSADGTKTYSWDMSSIFIHRGMRPPGWEMEWGTSNYYSDGVLHSNYGTIMCAAIHNGDKDLCYLVDVSKLQVLEDNEIVYPEDTTGTDEFGDYPIVASSRTVITDESLIAIGEYIELGETNYWLIKNEGKWGYIDHSGTEIAMFDDAAKFTNGYAMIIEDGKAYFIDENMQKFGEGIPATTVRTYGELFEVTTDAGKIYLSVPQ